MTLLAQGIDGVMTLRLGVWVNHDVAGSRSLWSNDFEAQAFGET